MPTQGNIKNLCTDRFNLLEESVYMFQSKGRILLLGNFSGRVGKSEDVAGVIRMFMKGTWNSNDNVWLNYSKIAI